MDKIYQEQSKTVKDLSDAFRRVVAQNQEDIEISMREFKSAYDNIVHECKRSVEQKLEEFIGALNKTLDVEDANRKLSNLDRLKNLESELEDIKKAVYDKSAILEVSRAIQEGNSKLDNLGSRRVSAQASLVNGEGDSSRKRRGIWPFRRKM